MTALLNVLAIVNALLLGLVCTFYSTVDFEEMYSAELRYHLLLCAAMCTVLGVPVFWCKSRLFLNCVYTIPIAFAQVHLGPRSPGPPGVPKP